MTVYKEEKEMKRMLIELNKGMMIALWVLVLLVGTALDNEGFTALRIEAVLVTLLSIISIIYHLTKTERRH